MTLVTVRISRLPHAADLELPGYETAGSAGLDLRAAIADRLEIAAGQRAVVPTGLLLAIPPGFEGQVRARSGRAFRDGLTVLNGPGTIDSDYRGEIGVLLANLGDEGVVIVRGERIAQLVVAPVMRAHLVEDDTLNCGETERGAGGFGSTG